MAVIWYIEREKVQRILFDGIIIEKIDEVELVIGEFIIDIIWLHCNISYKRLYNPTR